MVSPIKTIITTHSFIINHTSNLKFYSCRTVMYSFPTRRFFSSWEVLTRQAIHVVEGPKNVGLKAIAGMDLPMGTVINEFTAPVFRNPTMHTVCIANGIHVAPTFGAECISHACGPNTNVSIRVNSNERGAKVVVTKDVPKGEDLYFNYNTTEWTMSCPFQCSCQKCQAEGKSRLVQGFSHLSNEEQDELLLTDQVSSYVRSLVMKQRKQKAQISIQAVPSLQAQQKQINQQQRLGQKA